MARKKRRAYATDLTHRRNRNPHPALAVTAGSLLKNALALQLRSISGSDSLGHHDSEIMDDGRVGGGDAGAVGLVVAGCEGADAAAVPAGPNGSLGRALSGCAARA